jgi:hypothetical protein
LGGSQTLRSISYAPATLGHSLCLLPISAAALSIISRQVKHINDSYSGQKREGFEPRSLQRTQDTDLLSLCTD